MRIYNKKYFFTVVGINVVAIIFIFISFFTILKFMYPYDFDGFYIQNKTLLSCDLSKQTGDTIYIPDGVEKIGSFNSIFDSQHTSYKVTIVLPSSVKTIASRAFANTDFINKIILNDGLETIESYAFESISSITELNIPNSVKSIDKGAFRWCESLSSVKLPIGLTQISSELFSSCNSLENIVIPKTVTKIVIMLFVLVIN